MKITMSIGLLQLSSLLMVVSENCSRLYTALKNAVDSGTAPLIKNLQDYETPHELRLQTFNLGSKNSWISR